MKYRYVNGVPHFFPVIDGTASFVHGASESHASMMLCQFSPVEALRKLKYNTEHTPKKTSI